MMRSIRSFSVSFLLIICIICCTGSVSRQSSSQSQQVFVEPEASYRPVLDSINMSAKSIRMEIYFLNDQKIIDALTRAKSRGVNVRVILEKWAYPRPSDFNAVVNDLNLRGISTETSSPAFRLTHEKSIVLDDKIALIMTLNQDRTAYSKNREFGIIDSNTSDVTEMAEVFDDDWNRTEPKLSDSRLVWSPVNSRDRIIKLIDSAKKNLDVENEEMQDQEVEDHLISAAEKGVNVRVVMSGYNSTKDANAPGRDRIDKGGAKVRLLNKPYIHAKLVIADGSRAFVGSENFSPTSLDKNRELGILVNDRKIIRALTRTFDKDWTAGRIEEMNSSTTSVSRGVVPITAFGLEPADAMSNGQAAT